MTAMEEQCAPYLAKLHPEPYATIVPDRSPEVKFHAGLGRAKSAVAYREQYVCGDDLLRQRVARGGEIYELSETGWRLLYRVESGTATADLPWRTAARP
jgi:hypothetical protein